MKDLLNDALTTIKNAERIEKPDCITPGSRIVTEVLSIMKKHGYITDFDAENDKFKVKLNKKINACGVIKPKHAVKKDGFEKWEKRFLPARGFGILILTTSGGIMSHDTAKKNKVGGRLLAYVY